MHCICFVILDSSTNEVSLQVQCIVTLEICKHSHFMYCVAYVAPNYKAIFITKQGYGTHWYMSELIPLSTICTIAFKWFSSHSLLCKKWSGGGTRKKIPSKCIFFLEQVWEFEYTMLNLWSHPICFPHVWNVLCSIFGLIIISHFFANRKFH
mgnify:CR=1 FL=1